MDFIRARSGEQKRIRIEQITEVAAELYVEIGYDKVTYSEIGRKLNFTRRNLYNYFRCKEDIFLTLLLQDIENMVEDAEKTFTEPVEDQEKFCLAWAGMLLRHQRMLALFGIVNTVILKDATSDVHRSFRIEMNRSFNRLKVVVQRIFPQFSEEQAYQFVEYENSYAMTLYPASLEYKEFHHIEIFPDAGFGTKGFVPQFVKFLRRLLKGLRE